MDQIIDLIDNNFFWFPELGFGYYPVKEAPYDEAYFKKYEGYAATEMGKKITQSRIDFVSKFFEGELVDIGIGCGDFVKERLLQIKKYFTFGYDINPKGIEWLQGGNKLRGAGLNNNLFYDPYKHKIKCATFWDSLEHIADPGKLLKNIEEWIFVSIPIFADAQSVLKSKHFRKDEHIWYFSRNGFENFMKGHGFKLVEASSFETDLGRDGIMTFAFQCFKD